MALPTVDLDGQTVPLLTPLICDRRRPIILEPTLPCAVTAALTRRESRRPRALCPRWRMATYHTLAEGQAADFRTLLATNDLTRVGMPVWPLRRQKSAWATRLLEAQVVLNLTTGAVYTGADVSAAAANDWLCPLLIGALARPRIEAQGPLRGSWRLELTERSPWQHRLDVAMDGTAAGDPFPQLSPDWSQPVIDLSDDAIELTQVGEARETVAEGQEAPFRWGQEVSFNLAQEDLHTLLRHWRAQQGRYASFVLPVWFTPHATATPETPNALVGGYEGDTLRLEFDLDTRGLASRVGFLQKPWELNPPAGDTFALPPEAHLHTTTYAVPVWAGGPLTRYETDWESPLTLNGQLYTPAPIEWTEYEEGDLLNSDAAQVIRAFPEGDDAHPLARAWRGEAEAPVTHAVDRVDPTAGSPTPTRLFAERVARPELEDRMLEIQVGGITPREVPTIVIAREALSHVPETYLIRSGVLGSGGALTWDDAEEQGNPASGRYTGWIAESLASGTRQTVTGHTRTASGATLAGLSGGDFASGQRILLYSPYLRRGTITSVHPNEWNGTTQYRLNWNDGGSNAVAGTLDHGVLYIGTGEDYQERIIAKHWDASGFAPAANAAVAFQRDLRGTIATGTTVRLFPGWDGTWSQLKSRFPLGQDYAILFPFTPLKNVTAENRDPFARPETGAKK